MHTKITTILTFLLFIATDPAFAKETKYRVADIPKELKENARSIVRNEEIILAVKSRNNATLSVTYAITILNKNGLEDAYFTELYDKFTKIKGVKGRIFNEDGELIKRVPAEDILDYSAISGFSIYEDTRVKYIDPKIRNFPFTVEYSYEQSFDGFFSYPSWHPQPKFNLAVEKSSYKALVARDVVFRYLEQNTSSKVAITSDRENNIYYWEARNLKAMESEPYSVSNQEIFPAMIAAPADFEIDGYQGNLSSWENFGVFISKLNTGRDILTDDSKNFLNGLVAATSNDLEKVRKIYEYMQGRVRYVSIQIGIGGWQPFDAATVHRLAYGDCKALTNYMKTMLDLVGIRSNYCLVNAGEAAPMMIREFPSAQFNHAFLCVPLKNDTIWLECTSQRTPCGYIGRFTDDRDILLIDGEKSRILHSKAYSSDDNQETHISHVRIDENGKGSVETHAIYKGLKYETILPAFLADDADKKRRISECMKFPGFQVVDFKYKESKAIIPSIEETLSLNFENYLTSMGSRKFLLMNFSNRNDGSVYSLRSRKTAFCIRRPSVEMDTIIYELPSTLKPETLPKPVSIKNQFGEYRVKVEYLDNKLYYTRMLQLNKGQYPPTDYAGFVDFFDNISMTDNMQCALIKN